MLPLRKPEARFDIPDFCESIDICIDDKAPPDLLAKITRDRLASFFQGKAIKIRISVKRGLKNIHVAIKKASGIKLTDEEREYFSDMRHMKGVQINITE